MERRRSERRNGTPVYVCAFVYIQCVSAWYNNVTGMLQGPPFLWRQTGEEIALQKAANRALQCGSANDLDFIETGPDGECKQKKVSK